MNRCNKMSMHTCFVFLLSLPVFLTVFLSSSHSGVTCCPPPPVFPLISLSPCWADSSLPSSLLCCLLSLASITASQQLWLSPLCISLSCGTFMNTRPSLREELWPCGERGRPRRPTPPRRSHLYLTRLLPCMAHQYCGAGPLFIYFQRQWVMQCRRFYVSAHSCLLFMNSFRVGYYSGNFFMSF